MVRLRSALLLTVAALGGQHMAWAQQGPSSTADGGSVALAQRGWEFTPSIGLDLTYTDNVGLGGNSGKSDLISRLSPGIRLQGQGPRARAYIDYKLQQINYASASDNNRLQHSLNSTGTLELVDKWLYLDLSGRISRQAISAFGVPSSGSDSVNANMVESTMYQVSPYIKGRMANVADYLLRVDNTWYDSSGSSALRNTTMQSVQGSLSGATPLARLNWGLDANYQQTSYASNAKHQTDSTRGNLRYAFDPQFRVQLIGGRESNDYINFQQRTSSITGWGFEWAPTERTQLSWTQENRYFGQGHRFNFTHRTPFTAWRVSDVRDVMLMPPQSLTFGMGTYFDMLNMQLVSMIPDDAERARYIESLLQAMNIPRNAQVLGGFMSSRASLNRTRELSFTINGVRNMFAVSAQTQDRTALGTGQELLPDDFTNFSNTIRQRGINANWAYKLTPTATFSAMANLSRTLGEASNLQIKREGLTLMLSNKLGARTSGSIGLRTTKVTGYTVYDENALLASLFMSF